MEIELDEEKSSVELLNDRVTRSREQVELCEHTGGPCVCNVT